MFSYSGLTLLFSRTGRHGVMGGVAGEYVWKTLATGGESSFSTDVQCAEHGQFRLKPGTKVVVLFGEELFSQFYRDPEIKLGQAHGYAWLDQGIYYIATFEPQDAFDRRKVDLELDGFDEPEEEPDTDSKSTKGVTRRKNYFFWLTRDLRKALRLLKTPPGPIAYTEPVNYYESQETLVRILRETRGSILYFDIETDSELNITCFAFKFTGQPTYSVAGYGYKKLYHYPGFAKILWALQIAFQHNEVVIHNSMFDLFVMTWKYRLLPPKRVFDTMLSHARLVPEVEKSLGRCIAFYVDHLPYHKNEGIFEPHNFVQTQQLLEYNAKDVESLAAIAPEIKKAAVSMGAADSLEQVNGSIRAYLLATLQGMRVDLAKISEIALHNERAKIQATRVLRLMTGVDLNPRSPQQVSKYIYHPKFKTSKPAEEATAEKTLLKLRLKVNNPAITVILKAREFGMKMSKMKFNIFSPTPFIPYSEALRITTGYKLAGTTTYRLSSAKLLGRWGNNLQNFEKALRKIVIPDAGMEFVQVDQSGAEALIVAYLTRAGKFRQMFNVGIKSHVYVALNLFQKQWEQELGYSIADIVASSMLEISKHPKWPEVDALIKESDNWPGARRYYYIAKMVVHASNYGMKAPTFQINVLQKSEGTIVMSRQQADLALNSYHELFPEIRSWHSDVINKVLTTRMLHNLFGYPRYFSGHLDSSQQKEWFAFRPQSTVGTITNRCFSSIQREIETSGLYGSDILENNHDSVLLQVPLEHSRTVGAITKKHMNQQLMNDAGEVFYMKSNASYGNNWYDMKEEM